MKSSKILVSVIFFVMTMTSAVVCLGQPGNPGDPGDNPVPITGIEILLLSGGALGGYQFMKKRKNRNI